MKAFKLHAPDEAHDDNVRTFTPQEDGTVKVWMFIRGTDGDADMDCLDAMLSEADAVAWADMFEGQGWVREDAPDYEATEEDAGIHHYDAMLDCMGEDERIRAEEDAFESCHNR